MVENHLTLFVDERFLGEDLVVLISIELIHLDSLTDILWHIRDKTWPHTLSHFAFGLVYLHEIYLQHFTSPRVNCLSR